MVHTAPTRESACTQAEVPFNESAQQLFQEVAAAAAGQHSLNASRSIRTTTDNSINQNCCTWCASLCRIAPNPDRQLTWNSPIVMMSSAGGQVNTLCHRMGNEWLTPYSDRISREVCTALLAGDSFACAGSNGSCAVIAHCSIA